MKHSLHFEGLTVEQLGLLLAAWNDINAKMYNPKGDRKIPEPRVWETQPPGADPDKIVVSSK